MKLKMERNLKLVPDKIVVVKIGNGSTKIILVVENVKMNLLRSLAKTVILFLLVLIMLISVRIPTPYN